ncbi:MAG: molybdenum cofactor guanylyltransferase MobA [Campylobacterales bacterium]|nr:molybdenum cofactor guanylyltransferase MobA [Campylobacterales bacterium]
MIDFHCVIVAGGKSSRMGEDKSLLPFGEFNSLAEFQHNRLSKIFQKVSISSKNNKFDFECEVIEDLKDFDEFSPMVAIYSIFESLKSDAFLISVDTPFVDEDIIYKLFENFKSDVSVAKTDRLHPLCGFYKKSIHDKIKECLKNDIHKLNFLLKQLKCDVLDFSEDERFLNLNYKDEYEKAKKILMEKR